MPSLAAFLRFVGAKAAANRRFVLADQVAKFGQGEHRPLRLVQRLDQGGMVTIYGTVEQLMDAAGTTTIMPGADKIEHREIGVSSMGMAKLTLAQCREIIAMRGTMPQKVIAAKYGVSESAVSRLLKWVA